MSSPDAQPVTLAYIQFLSVCMDKEELPLRELQMQPSVTLKGRVSVRASFDNSDPIQYT
jgi:hypothetical protein